MINLYLKVEKEEYYETVKNKSNMWNQLKIWRDNLPHKLNGCKVEIKSDQNSLDLPESIMFKLNKNNKLQFKEVRSESFSSLRKMHDNSVTECVTISKNPKLLNVFDPLY